MGAEPEVGIDFKSSFRGRDRDRDSKKRGILAEIGSYLSLIHI